MKIDKKQELPKIYLAAPAFICIMDERKLIFKALPLHLILRFPSVNSQARNTEP
jgi:hypothetical protein